MQVLSRLILLLLALSLSVTGCAGQGGPNDGAPVDQRDDQAADGTGTGDGDADKLVPGAPIDIPNITIAQGRPVDEVRAEIEAELRKRCGGTVCVKLTTEARDDNLKRCEFSTTDPRPGTRVRRGSVVVIVTGTQPCQSSSPTGGESPDGEESPDAGASPEGETSPDDETSSEGETSPG
jgi:beta-lactam-binding protein with PASTA domain